MKYIIKDIAENNINYIKEGSFSREEFSRFLMNELDSYVNAIEESFTIEVNGVAFIVEK